MSVDDLLQLYLKTAGIEFNSCDENGIPYFIPKSENEDLIESVPETFDENGIPFFIPKNVTESVIISKPAPVPTIDTAYDSFDEFDQNGIPFFRPTFGPELPHDRTYNIVYIIRNSRDKNSSIYKIGKTKNSIAARLSGYPTCSYVILYKDLNYISCDIMELILIDLFKAFYKLSRGMEYFTGDIHSMIYRFNTIVDRYDIPQLKGLLPQSKHKTYKCCKKLMCYHYIIRYSGLSFDPLIFYN